LALSIGPEQATALATAFLQDTVDLARSMPWAHVILAADTSMLNFPGLDVWSQGEGDLGTRMERILARALKRHPFAIALGSDSPGMPSCLLENSRTALRTHDSVLGPADDGGFYLLGLRACPAGLLENLSWSRPETG